MVACPQCAAPAGEGVPRTDRAILHICARCREAYLIEPAGNGTIHSREAVPPPPLKDRIAPESVMAGIFECLEQSLDQLPTVPEVPQRVIAAIHDPITTTQDLANLINEDAAMSMRVLKLANSVFSSSRHAITDLRLACARLGNRAIANIAHMVAHGQLYRSGNPAFRELMDQLWRHSVATARLAEVFARHIENVDPSNLFLAGLTHDVGKPVLLDVITNRYTGRVGQLKESWDLLVQTLDEFAPYVGLRVVRHWGLTDLTGFTVFYTGQPDAAPEAYRRAVYIVALASDTAEASGYGILARESPVLDAHPALSILQDDSARIQNIIDEAAAHVDPYLEFGKTV